ncbi:MAG: xylulokinase [Hungatella sp.]|nr:xylulokinase [Hungatella sp.]
MEYVMGIDLGTSSVKAVLMNREGKTTVAAGREYEIMISHAGYAVQDPEDWWRKTKEAAVQVLAHERALPDSVKGIGFSGQMHGLVALDREGKPLMPAVIWMDQRAGAQQKRIMELVREKGLEKELMNKPLTGMMICSLLWVKDNEPDIYRKIAHVLLPKDYIRYRFGGGYDTDETDAGGSLAFSVRDRKWCVKLLEALEISPELFPEVLRPYEPAGMVSEEAARETGLKEGTMLAAGGADSAMQLTGNGIVSEECLCCNIGTASQILAVSSKPLYDKELRTQTLCHSIPGFWYVQCGSLNGGSALGWLRKKILKTEKSYEQLDREAGETACGCKGLVFLPHLAGERAPFENPYARGVFSGLSMETEQAHLVRAVMEGVAMNLRLCYDLFYDMGLGSKKYLVMSGGGAKGETWRRIFADVFRLPVYRTKGTEEACAGAALMAAAALGWYSSVKEGVEHRAGLEAEPLFPVDGHVSLYEEMRGRFAGLYDQYK